MCLICKTDPPTIAQEDITCYKIVVLHDGVWESPYTKVPQEFCEGKVITSRTTVEEFSKLHNSISKYVLIRSGIHSYEKLTDLIRNWIQYFLQGIEKNWNYRIVKCTIPKDTSFYKGRFNIDKASSFSSHKVVMNEILFENRSIEDIHKLIDIFYENK